MRRLLCALAACGHPPDPPVTLVDAGIDAVPPQLAVSAVIDSRRFVTREHMLAASEMQISGEPLAEAMGRDLGGYSRIIRPPDLYSDPVLNVRWVDPAGFSTAIESYEYSKQPMNFLAFESGAGTSLVHAPLVNFDAATGAAATAHLAALVAHYAAGSDAAGKWVFPAGTFPIGNPLGDVNPTGTGLPSENPIGWPGIWPTTHVFASFDPAIDPTNSVGLRCSISSDDTPGNVGTREICGDYECDATALHLRDRAAQIDPAITPGADGFTTWKYGLWVINYLQVMHDVAEQGVDAVDEADLASVGAGGPIFLGSSDIEGFQAQMFLLEVDARADDWLARLTTADGATLSGFASIGAALAYDFTAPLRWFPGRIAVTETNDGSGFPVPSYSLASANSELLDLVGVALGYAEIYALTDTANADVGGSQPARAFFDGDPFAADDQLADGDATLHDRALAMIRVALVNLDRLHVDPTTGLCADTVTINGTTPVRGATISTTSAAYTVIGLRTVLRSLTSQLALYSNNTPDTAGTSTPLDALPLHHPGAPTLKLGDRVRQIVRAHAALLYDHLTDSTGRAWSGWNLAANAPIDDRDELDAHTAAIRGLFAAFLATGDVRYRDRAIAVYARVEAVFYDPVARIYSQDPAPVTSATFTPLRFALLQSSLRDMYELVATRPGGNALAIVLEDRFARLDKLVLNGWDDRDRDQRVFQPECVAFDAAHLPAGGLQMAERALTGELGRATDEGSVGPPSSDRDYDCVPEIDDAHLPAGLADSITFTVARP